MPRSHEIGEATSVDTRIRPDARVASSSVKPTASAVVQTSAQLPKPRLAAPPPTGSRSNGAPQSPMSGMSAPATNVSATPAPVPAAASNVIPFAKPRAISQMPVTFSQPQTTHSQPSYAQPQASHSQPSYGQPQASYSQPSYSQPTSWGSAAVAMAPSPEIAPPPPVIAPPPPTLMAMPEAPAVVAPPPVAVATPSRWAAFEKLGLGGPKIDHKKLSGHLVTAYRLLGFVILSIIVVVLIGYLVTTAFFYMSDSWIVPMAISPTDEKVVSLQSQLAERQTNRDRTAAELDQAERAIAVQQEFQTEFAKAIKSDLDGRKAALARMYELANVAASTRAQIKRSNSAYASASQRRMAQEWRAGLIDRNSMLNGKYQLAQITSSNLSLAERQAEYETRAADLDAQTRSLEALLENRTTEGSLSYDVLKIKQEYEASRLETQRAIENRDMLRNALAREDKLVASLKQASYLRALADGAHVAFVPYANLDSVKKGEPVYGCALTMVFCKKVGTVLEVLPGEVQSKHPNRDKMLRGQMVELRLEAAVSATDDVLFVGGRPMLL